MKKVVILVPSWSGGIDRLFEMCQLGQLRGSNYHITTFKSHGRSLYGLRILPFRLVYYTSALFYTLVLLPFRLLLFTWICLFRQIDVCHINLSTGASTIRKMLFAWICRIFKVRYVVHLHGGKYRQYLVKLPSIIRNVVCSFFRNADHVIVLGRLWKDFVIQSIGVNESKVAILPNAVVGPSRYSRSDKNETLQILFLGRLLQPKGVEELIDALLDPRLQELQWTAVVAGDGELSKYRHRIRQSAVSDRISIPGWLDAEDVRALLRTASIFVLPSHSENFPLSMLEAMSYGLCPIVTPVGSITDAVEDNRNGLLVPTRNANALVDALITLLEQPEKCRALGENARSDFLLHYDMAEYRGRLESIYDLATNI